MPLPICAIRTSVIKKSKLLPSRKKLEIKNPVLRARVEAVKDPATAQKLVMELFYEVVTSGWLSK